MAHTPTGAAMPRQIQLKTLGGSVAAILPKDILERQGLAASDAVFAKEHRAAMAALAKL
jgi:antitoxin component of MazEF toxin-antitoxin module